MRGRSGSGSVPEEDSHLVLSSSEDSSTPDECELGLGLSLGGFGGNGGSLKLKLKAQRIGPKILTAEDFDTVVSASSSSPSSCSSTSSTPGRANGGTKRAADSISAPNAASQVVGWPPIRAYRMNNLATNNGKSKEFDSVSEKRNCSGKMNHQDSINLCIKPFLVKVNMDGVPIGRKVDLNSHNCYETLAQTVENMFFSTTPKNVNAAARMLNLLNGSSGFALTYEDKEGDIMLLGDVPWRMFVNSVKRLRIVRSTNANGIICI